MIQRAPSGDKGQGRGVGLKGGDVSGGIQSQINSARGGGQPLSPSVGESIGAALGADFSGVRIHADGQADRLNRSLSAKAFTLGRDVFFSRGSYNPGTSGGKKLLAHELTHVVQQGATDSKSSGNKVQTKLAVGPADDKYEREAEGVAKQSGSITRSLSSASASPARLQRTLRAPAQIQRTTGPDGEEINWANTVSATPSSEGAMGGVFFVKVGTVMHVVKSSDNPSAALLAEQVVEDIGGGLSTKSQPVKADSDEGRAIIAAIQTHPPQRKDGESDDAYIERQNAHANKLDIFKAAKYLMIQRAMSGTQLGLSKINEEVKGNEGLNAEDPKKLSAEAMNEKINAAVAKQVAILENETALKNIGRVMAADTLVGNADRFEQMNTGNAFITEDGKVGAIDTEAIMQQYDAFIEFAKGTQGRAFAEDQIKGATSNDYTNFMVGGGGRQISDSNQAAPSSAIQRIAFDFDNWFNQSFVSTFYTWKHALVIQAMATQGYPKPEGRTLGPKWLAVRAGIKAGFDEGMARVRTAVGGPQLKNLKVMFNLYTSTYGKSGAENFDLHGLKVRGRYMKSTAEGANQEEAFGSTLNYVKYVNEFKPQYRIQMNAITNVPPTLLDVPALPPELKKKEKMKRAFTFSKSREEKKAREDAQRLKKQARKGEVDEELEASVKGSAELSGRRADKALTEVQFARFKQGFSTRAQLLADLDLDVRRFRAQSKQGGDIAEIAGKKLIFIKKQFDTGDRGALWKTQNDLSEAKMKWDDQIGREQKQQLADSFYKFGNAHQWLVKQMK